MPKLIAGELTFNATNLKDDGGSLNTDQDIDTTASPTFVGINAATTLTIDAGSHLVGLRGDADQILRVNPAESSGTGHNLTISSGQANTTGNGGNLLLNSDVGAGAGTRGEIQFWANEYEFRATPDENAIIRLDELSSWVFKVKAQSSSGAGKSLTIKSGDANTTGEGGALFLTAGTGFDDGEDGDISLTGNDFHFISNSAIADITLNEGQNWTVGVEDSTGTDEVGYDLTISAGDSSADGDPTSAGDLLLNAGADNGGIGSVGGDIILTTTQSGEIFLISDGNLTLDSSDTINFDAFTIVLSNSTFFSASSVHLDRLIVNDAGSIFLEKPFQAPTWTLENPTSSEDKWPIFTKLPIAITITDMNVIVVGSSTPSVTIDPKHGTDLSAAGTSLLSSPTAVTNTTTGATISSFNDASLGIGEHLWMKTTAQSGVVTKLSVSIRYTID